MSEFQSQSEDGLTLRGTIFEGPKTPKAVISLAHGFGEHCDRYAPMAAHLKQHDIAMVAIDLRGHGRSDGKRGRCKNYDDLHGDLRTLLSKTRETYPNIPHFLMGHSMGGGLVLHYTLNNGQGDLAGVISQAPLIQLTKPPSEFLRRFTRGLRRVAPMMTLSNKISGTQVSTLVEEREKYENDPLNHSVLGVGMAVGMIEAGREILAKADHWTAPLLLMHSRNDQLTSFEGTQTFASQVKNCQFVPFEHVEHEIHNDLSRADVYARVIKFVGSLI